MQLQLVTFEQAKALKEAGFDWSCQNHFSALGHYYETDLCGNFNDDEDTISRPTIAHALMWLREVKWVHTDVRLTYKGNYFARVVKIADNSSVVSTVIPTYLGAERLVLTKALETLKTVNDGK